MRSLSEEFLYFRGQPVEIMTNDNKRFCGIVLDSDVGGVSLIDNRTRIILIPFAHINAVVEPKMRLKPLCDDDTCECEEREHEHDRDHDIDRFRR